MREGLRDAVNESLADGTLRLDRKNDRDSWRTTNKAEDVIGLFILPVAQNVILVALGAIVLGAGLDGFLYGHRVPTLGLTGLGVIIVAACALFWLLQRRMERRIWQIERKNSDK